MLHIIDNALILLLLFERVEITFTTQFIDVYKCVFMFYIIICTYRTSPVSSDCNIVLYFVSIYYYTYNYV